MGNRHHPDFKNFFLDIFPDTLYIRTPWKVL